MIRRPPKYTLFPYTTLFRSSLYSTKRDEFQSRIFKSIESDFKIRGLVLEQLLVRNITLPQSVKTTIEQKIKDRKSTRLNSSHSQISYAVFCLKKKKKKKVMI